MWRCDDVGTCLSLDFVRRSGRGERGEGRSDDARVDESVCFERIYDLEDY